MTDTSTEKQILGALMVKPELRSSIEFKPDYFSEQHRPIVSAIYEIRDTVDALGVINFLKAKSQLDRAGGSAYILDMVKDVLAPQHAQMHFQHLRAVALRRELYDVCREIQNESLRPVLLQEEPDFLASVQQRVSDVVSQSFRKHRSEHVSAAKSEVLDFIKDALDQKKQGYSTGYPGFDRLIGGLTGNKLIVLAGRPGKGKTSLAFNIAAHVAKSGKEVQVYSVEMDRKILLLRQVCAYARIDLNKMLQGILPTRGREAILEAMGNIFSLPIYIDDISRIDISEIEMNMRNRATVLKQRGEKIGLLVIDFVQYLSDKETVSEGKAKEVTSISRKLKQLTKDLDVPILALSSMNRDNEKRKGAPQMSDLKDGGIESDADVVAFLHGSKERSVNDAQLIDLILSKNRNGPLGKATLTYRPEMFRFDSFEVSEQMSFPEGG